MDLDLLQGTVSKNADAKKKSPGTFYGTQGHPHARQIVIRLSRHLSLCLYYTIISLIIVTCSEYSRLIGFTSQISPRPRGRWQLGSDRPILSPLITYILINYSVTLRIFERVLGHREVFRITTTFISLYSAIKHLILKLERGGILHIVLTHYRIVFIASFFNSWYRRVCCSLIINRYGG